jgi:hypothetical protein
LAAVVDLLVLIAWLLAIVFRQHIGAPRKLYSLVTLCGIAAMLYTPRHRPPSYPPPTQKGADTRPVSLVLPIHESPMDEQWAVIAGGILPADKASQWAWTTGRPHLRFLIDESERWVFYLRFAAAGAVLRAVGPQTIQIAINGTSVKTVAAAEPREYELRVPVDPALLKPGSMNDVELRVAPVYIAGDGVTLGILLHSVGFLEDTNP